MLVLQGWGSIFCAASSIDFWWSLREVNIGSGNENWALQITIMRLQKKNSILMSTSKRHFEDLDFPIQKRFIGKLLFQMIVSFRRNYEYVFRWGLGSGEFSFCLEMGWIYLSSTGNFWCISMSWGWILYSVNRSKKCGCKTMLVCG